MSLNIDDSAVKRIQDLRAAQGKDGLMLRITVHGGGCSGFKYVLELTDIREEMDLTFADSVVTDQMSMPYLTGSTIAFEGDLTGEEFVIKNPNASSGCGCGGSFGV